MTWVAVAVGGSAVLGAGASYFGSKKQSDAAKQAGQMNLGMFNTLNAQQQPFIQSGYGSLGRLNTLLGLGGAPRSAMPSNPGYAPTPGGGVRPLMQMGPQMSTQQQGAPGGGSLRLADILQLRAAHGDTQAAAMLQRLGGG